jgi:hypothetical protein
MQMVSQIELVRWSTLQLKLAQFIFLERLVRHTSNGATEQNSFHEAVHVYTHITLQATNFRHFSRACRSKSECEISFVSPLVWSRWFRRWLFRLKAIPENSDNPSPVGTPACQLKAVYAPSPRSFLHCVPSRNMFPTTNQLKLKTAIYIAKVK